MVELLATDVKLTKLCMMLLIHEHAGYSVYMYKFNSDWIGQGHCFKTATMVSVKGTKGQETMEQCNNSITILLYSSQRRIS